MADRSMFGPDWTVAPTGNGNEHHLFDHRGKVAATGYKGEKLQYVADCVNACSAIPDPSAVGELVELLGLALYEVKKTMSPELRERIDAALSKATQGER